MKIRGVKHKENEKNKKEKKRGKMVNTVEANVHNYRWNQELDGNEYYSSKE